MPVRPGYRAPGSVRLILHVAVIAAIVIGSVLTLALDSSRPRHAAALAQASSIGAASQPLTTETLARQPQQLLDHTGVASDSMLLAVLSLESSNTPQEVDQSIERIHALGVPRALAPTPTPTSTTEPAEPECAADASHPSYCVYTVVTGDTVSGIAQTLGFMGNTSISGADMLAESNKPDVVSSDHIETGQHLRVPMASGIIHTVLRAETVSDVAQAYGATADAIIASPYNQLDNDATLLIGQNLLVPDPRQIPVNEPATLDISQPEATPADEETPAAADVPDEAEPTATDEAQPVEPPPVDTPSGEDAAGATATPEPATATPTPTATARPKRTPTPKPGASTTPVPGSNFFIWPVQGPISSYFGPSHPLGIDIDLYNNHLAQIRAARGGTVTFAGGDACCSYGLYVIVDHGNGLQTLYAHLSKIDVSEGDEVDQGDVLGISGVTGNSTGEHLHFEIRVNGSVVDPLMYLPEE